jgi:hypothetical protein
MRNSPLSRGSSEGKQGREVKKVVNNLQSGEERNIDKNGQLFRSPLAFYPAMEDVCCPGSGTKQAQPAVRRKALEVRRNE